MSKTKIELRPLLPNVTEPNDACFRRLIVLLESKAGVNAAHISGSEDGHPERICIHFNSEIVLLGEVRELAKRAGVEINNRYGHWLGQSTAMHAGRASAIESRLQRIAGVIEAAVSPEGAVRVEYDRQLTNDNAIADALKKWTRGVSEASDESEASDGHAGHLHGEEGPEEDHGHAGHKLANGDHAHGGIFGPKSELIFAILCGVFLLVGWLVETFAELKAWISLGCYLAALRFKIQENDVLLKISVPSAFRFVQLRKTDEQWKVIAEY